ncbi:NAD(P)-dependent oxidoreductase [Chloroflexota bacterium]
MNVGFIGIGKMGGPMSRHVLEAGYNLVVYDLNKKAAQPLLEKGAKWMNTPKQVAESCEIVLTCLPGPPEMQAVVYGANGLMVGWKKDDVYVDMSTNSPTIIRLVAAHAKAKGVAVLDAPVSGGTTGAEAGTLAIMVGGDAYSFEKVRKVLEAMGKNIFHVGDVGCGNIVKLVNNMMTMSCSAITAECLVLGAKAGVDIRKLHEVIKVSTGNNYVLERSYPGKVYRGNFEPGFRISLALKDIGLALTLAKECGALMPVGAVVEQRFLEAKAAGLDEKSSHAIILRLEELAGVQVRIQE